MVFGRSEDADVFGARADGSATQWLVADSEHLVTGALAALARDALPVGTDTGVAPGIAGFAVVDVSGDALIPVGADGHDALLARIGRLGTSLAILPKQWEYEHRDERKPRHAKRAQVGH
jgi:hypothetical protein